MQVSSLQFGGIYIQNLQGRASANSDNPESIELEIAVTNDEQGNHQDQFASIVAPSVHDTLNQNPESIITLHRPGLDLTGLTYFWAAAGDNKTVKLDNEPTINLVRNLLREVKGLHPKLRNAFNEALDHKSASASPK